MEDKRCLLGEEEEEEKDLLEKERGGCGTEEKKRKGNPGAGDKNRFDEGERVSDPCEEEGQEGPNMPGVSNEHGAPGPPQPSDAPGGLGCPGDQAGPDGGWGWLVVVACFAATFTLDGIGYSFGMLMKPLKEEIGEGNFGTASVGSVQIAVYLVCGPLVARLVARLGARPVAMTGSLLAAAGLLAASLSQSMVALFASYSALGGFGLGFLYLPAVVASQAHFTRRRALAVGIAVCGTGVGTLTLPPVVEWMVERWGWRGALQGLATLCLSSTLCGAAMFPAQPDTTGSSNSVGTDSKEVETPTRCRGWRLVISYIVGPRLASSPNLPLFFVVLIGDFLATMSIYIPYTHLPALALAHGIKPQNAAFLISAAGISSTFGRIVAGLVNDQGRLHPMSLTLVATSLASGQAFLLTMSSKYWSFLTLASGFGFCTGMWVASETPLIIKTLSFSLLTPAFGLLTAGGGLAALSGPPIAGLLEDFAAKGNEWVTMAACGLIMGGSALAYSVATLIRKHRETRVESYQDIS